MTTAANKRSTTTLFSRPDDIYCHQVRIVLAEKSIPYEAEVVEPQAVSEDLLELNPRGTVPTLVDRDLVLFNAHIIMEYLDERFPHPPLMPVYPVARGQSRLLMLRIEQDWYPALALAEENKGDEAKQALKQLEEEIISISPIFSQTPYFMNEEFSLVDCYMAPLLWRMQSLGADFSGVKSIKAYMHRVFSRPSFIQSISGAAPKNLMDEK